MQNDSFYGDVTVSVTSLRLVLVPLPFSLTLNDSLSFTPRATYLTFLVISTLSPSHNSSSNLPSKPPESFKLVPKPLLRFCRYTILITNLAVNSVFRFMLLLLLRWILILKTYSAKDIFQRRVKSYIKPKMGRN